MILDFQENDQIQEKFDEIYGNFSCPTAHEITLENLNMK